MHIDFIRCYEKNLCHVKCIEIVYFWAQLNYKSDSELYILSQFILPFYPMYCNYNVTTYPMKIVTTYPKVVFLLEVPVNQTPMHTMQ